jgi:alkaline phosphatase
MKRHSKTARNFSITGLILSCCAMLNFLAAQGAASMPPPDMRPKNIILMIGDGMGLPQVSAALYSNNNRLHITQFPVVGFQKTYSYDNLVTDSAAGATAFASGRKTYNNAIGVSHDTLPLRSILEESAEKGLATGLVATSTIVHATPAAFFAHAASREYYEEIAADFLDAPIDLAIGGGKTYFDKRESDQQNLLDTLKAKGYLVTDYNATPLGKIKLDPSRPLLYFTAEKHPPGVANGRDYLELATRIGPVFLEKRSDKGFFLMVEGSQIDWACHQRDGKNAVLETLDFDRAVGEALKYAAASKNTLVIVTADHETGGMCIHGDSKMNRLSFGFTSNNHTASMVPVFAFGPGAELFTGIYENTDIFHKIRYALGMAGQATTASENHPATVPGKE